MRYLLAALFAFVAISAEAQTTAPITGEVLTIYRQGQSTPAVTPTTLNRANRLCNQEALPASTGAITNPNVAEWDDPDNAGRKCRWTDPGTGVLMMLALGTTPYEATLLFNSDAGVTRESVRSSLFTRPGAVPASPARV